MTWHRAWLLTGFRMAVGLLGFSALVTEVAVLTERHSFGPVDFFSYFTVESNLLVVVAMLLAALASAAGLRPSWLESLRAAVTVYILVVGVGFAVLLSGLEGVDFTAVPWDNVVLHYLVPVAAAADVLLDRPRLRHGFLGNLWWLLFPVAYAAYCLVRGAITDWYPYPFLDPRSHGYGGVAVSVVGLSVLGLLLLLGVTRVARRADGV